MDTGRLVFLGSSLLTLVVAVQSAESVGRGITSEEPLRSQAQSMPGGIEGDIYLVLRNGEIRQGAGRTVLLLRNRGSLEAGLARICQDRRERNESMKQAIQQLTDSLEAIPFEQLFAPLGEGLKAQKSALRDSMLMSESYARKKSLELLAGAIQAEASAGMNAHYSVSGVPVGEYVLFTEWQLATTIYRWWVPVTVAEGKTIRIDLNGDNITRQRLFCT